METFVSYLSTVWGAVWFALYPICLIILAALFTYAVTVESGAMATIRKGLAAVSDDRRVLALLIVWGLGTFMEGMAGFGTAVAIPAAILVGIGFDPMKAVLMCLVANTTPTAFGSVGVPIITLYDAAGLEEAARGLFVTTALLELAVTALSPVLILLVLDGWRGLKGMWGWLLVVDAVFLAPWLLAAKYIGCELPDILGGVAVMVTIGFVATRGRERGNFREQLMAWAPFGFVVAVLAVAALLPPDVKRFVPTGALVLAAGFCGGLLQGLKAKRMAKLLWETVVRYRKAFLTIITVLAVARVLERAGAIRLLADCLVRVAGEAYPFVATAVGALGGFLTGSGTNSCVLFGKLQADAATAIGTSPSLLAAANLMGAGIGKMVCPQSIAIGVAAAGLGAGGSKAVVRKMLPWFAAVLLLASVVTGVAALVF
ncbi:MAG: L-lactate permease [Kiritimatiellae bacterium]|nr:L-lactate permease [Kiritimatiellia bacterium]